mgnify:CR=1 FL=1
MRVWRSKPGEVLSATLFHLICGQQGVGPGSARHTRPRMHTILKWGVLHCAPVGATCTLILRTPFACDSPLWRRISVRSRNLSLRTAVPAQNENVCCNFGACIAKLKVFCVSMRRMCSPYQRRSPGRSPKAFRSRSIRSRSPLRACSCQSRRNANLETFFQVSRFLGFLGSQVFYVF